MWQSQLPAVDVSHSLGFLGIHFRQVRGNIFDQVASVMPKETSLGATSTLLQIMFTQARVPLVTVSDRTSELWILVVFYEPSTQLWVKFWAITVGLP